MSDTEGATPTSKSLLTTEFRDGQLQIIEVSSYGNKPETSTETQILPDLDSDDMPEERFVHVLNADKSMVQLDLLNMTLVRCEDGADTTYKLVANSDHGATDTDTVTCMLQTDEQEDPDNQDSYVIMEGEQGPLVFLQSELTDANVQPAKRIEEEPKKPSAVEILAKVKAIQRSAELLKPIKKRRVGRKIKNVFPSPHELLTSPNFKLFLYSCKMCQFKCNAIKEMTAHKAEEHSSGARVRAGRAGAPLQCAKCPYRTNTHSQLMKHTQERHMRPVVETHDVVSVGSLDSKEVDEAHILVCGACGFECNTKDDFKKHIKDKHGASADSI